MKGHFLERGFKATHMDECIAKALSTFEQAKQKQDRETIPLILTFDPGRPNTNTTLEKSMEWLQLDETSQ